MEKSVFIQRDSYTQLHKDRTWSHSTSCVRRKSRWEIQRHSEQIFRLTSIDQYGSGGETAARPSSHFPDRNVPHLPFFLFFTLSMWIIYFLAVGEDISKRSWHFWTTGFNPKSAWLPEAHLSLPWTNGSFYKWAQGISSNTNILKEDLCKTKHFFSLIEKSPIWMQQIHLTYIYVDPFMWKGGWLWLWQKNFNF